MNRLILVIVFLLINFRLAAQSNLVPTVPSPNASSLGIYGEMPVSSFTGVPDISVPIYEIKGNKIGLPISLSYHAGGLRVDAHPGWVGNGWSLNAGGVITRKVNSGVDEVPFSGYYAVHNMFNTSDWASDTKIKEHSLYLNLHPLDTEPDEFDFNFLNFSGKFCLNQQGNWQVQCDKNIRVVFDQADLLQPFLASVPNLGINSSYVAPTFTKFTLIDEFGNKYIFGSNDANNTAIEFSGTMVVPTGGRGSGFFATSWYLSKIISADGNENIDLNYERGPFTSHIAYDGYHNQTISGCGTNTTKHFLGLGGTTISPVYIKTISMPGRNTLITFNTSASSELTYRTGGSTLNKYAHVFYDAGYDPVGAIGIDFPSFYTLITSPSIIPYYSQNTPPGNLWDRFIWLQLNQIKVMTSSSSLLQTINFSYTNNPNKRLQLNEVSVNGKAYQFTYNSTSLPEYVSIYGDHWGFNNEGTSGNSLPQYSLSPTNGGNGGYPPSNTEQIREPDPTGVKTQAEILTDIQYPTGGNTHFDYEPNTYSSVIKRNINTTPVSETGIAGGLRVKQITNTINNAIVGQKNYYYVDGYLSNSNPNTLSSSGILDSKPLYTFTKNGIGAYGPPPPAVLPFTYSSVIATSTIPLTANSMSNHIGYKSVVEKRSDGSYSIFNFSNHGYPNATYNDELAVNSLNPGLFRAYIPTTSNYFKRGRLLQKTDFAHNGKIMIEESNAFNDGTSVILANAVNQAAKTICPPFAGQYQFDAYSKVAYNIKSASFFQTSSLTKKYSQISSDYVQTDKVLVYDNYKNITEERSTNSDGSVLITEYKYPYNFSTANSSNPYFLMTNNNITGVVVEKRIYREKAGIKWLISAEINTFKEFYTNKFYNEKKYVFDLVVPKLASTVSATTYTTQLNFDAGYILNETYQFSASGKIINLKKTSDVDNSFLWGYSNSVPVAQIMGADYNTVASFVNSAILNNPSSDLQLRNELNNIRTGLATTNAQVTTYTYKVPIGITSKTDPSNHTTYYEYDLNGRLSIIRDQDNNILKKICYNYFGQPVSCAQNCTNYNPDWQNTTAALRCKQGPCGNTGEQEQEQRDINPCSYTFDNTRWVVVGNNPGACPAQCVNLTSTNVTGISGYTAVYTDANNVSYPFAVPATTGLQPLGTLPTGNYTLTISRSTFPMYGTFKSGCFKQVVTGTIATFSSVAVSSITCNSITVDMSGIQ